MINLTFLPLVIFFKFIWSIHSQKKFRDKNPKISSLVLPMTQLFYSTLKMGIFAKNRAQYTKFWPRYESFKFWFFLLFFYFLPLWTKIILNQWVFKMFSKFYFTWSVITTLFYIITRGHKNPQKSKKKLLPPGNYQDPKSQCRKG